MTSTTSPRNMEDWMRIVERSQVKLRGIGGVIASAVETVKEEQQTKDNRHPTAPIELVYQTGLYTDTSSRRRVRFILDFPDVTKATDGTDLLIQQYELWGRDVTASILAGTTSAVPAAAAPGLTIPGLAATPTNLALEALNEKPWTLVDTSAASAFRTDGFIPGTVWEFRARAIGATTIIPGNFSETVTVQMLADTTPPPQPTAPLISVQRGTITATWDGPGVGGAMPADFKYAILAHGTASSPTMEIARFGRGGGFKVVANIDYYDPQFFRLQAVDESGNHGPWSEQGVGYTTPLVDKDIILSTIDAAKTHLKNINAGVSILPNTIITEHLVVTEDMTAALAQFLHVKAVMLEANEIWADEAWFGVADAILVRSDMFEGKAFVGGTFTGALFQSSVEDLDGIKWTDAGITAWSAGGVQTFHLDSATGNVTIGDGTFTGGMYQSVAAANSGVKLSAAGLKIWNTSSQLVLDATPSGATFTGTVKSGFGTSHASITDNAGRGRPGLQLAVNTTSYWQPQILAAAGADGWSSGTLMAVSGRNGSTSGDYYGMLTLGNGGVGWFLGATNGSGGILQSISAFSDLDTVQIKGGNGVMQASSSAVYLSAPSAVVQVEDNGTATISTSSGTTIFGGLSVSGSKSFVMDHPTKPGKELLHGATESPVSGVEYWGSGALDSSGEGSFDLPEYFGALIKDGSETVAVYGNGAVVAWGPVIGNSVAVSGPAGAEFSWLVKAERVGGDFPVERDKVEWTPPGHEPE